MIIRLACLIVSLFLFACAPGVTTSTSTGEKSDVSIDEVFSSSDKTGPSGAATEANSGSNLGTIAGVDQQSFQEFSDFKAWLRARQPNTPEFNEFQLWQEYLEYLRVTNQ